MPLGVLPVAAHDHHPGDRQLLERAPPAPVGDRLVRVPQLAPPGVVAVVDLAGPRHDLEVVLKAAAEEEIGLVQPRVGHPGAARPRQLFERARAGFSGELLALVGRDHPTGGKDGGQHQRRRHEGGLPRLWTGRSPRPPAPPRELEESPASQEDRDEKDLARGRPFDGTSRLENDPKAEDGAQVRRPAAERAQQPREGDGGEGDRGEEIADVPVIGRQVEELQEEDGGEGEHQGRQPSPPSERQQRREQGGGEEGEREIGAEQLGAMGEEVPDLDPRLRRLGAFGGRHPAPPRQVEPEQVHGSREDGISRRHRIAQVGVAAGRRHHGEEQGSQGGEPGQGNLPARLRPAFHDHRDHQSGQDHGREKNPDVLGGEEQPRGEAGEDRRSGSGTAGERQRAIEAGQGEEGGAVIVAGAEREDRKDVPDPRIGHRREGGVPAREPQAAGDRGGGQEREQGEGELGPARRHVAVAKRRDQHPRRELAEHRIERRARIPHREADHPQVAVMNPGGDRREVIRIVVESISARGLVAQATGVVEAHEGDRQEGRGQQGGLDAQSAGRGLDGSPRRGGRRRGSRPHRQQPGEQEGRRRPEQERRRPQPAEMPERGGGEHREPHRQREGGDAVRGRSQLRRQPAGEPRARAAERRQHRGEDQDLERARSAGRQRADREDGGDQQGEKDARGAVKAAHGHRGSESSSTQ